MYGLAILPVDIVGLSNSETVMAQQQLAQHAYQLSCRKVQSLSPCLRSENHVPLRQLCRIADYHNTANNTDIRCAVWVQVDSSITIVEV